MFTRYKTILRAFVIVGVVMVFCSIKMLQKEHTNSDIAIVDSNLVNIFVDGSSSSLNHTNFNIFLDTTRKSVVQNVFENKDISTPNISNIVKEHIVNSNPTWIQHVSFNHIKMLKFNFHRVNSRTNRLHG